MAGDGGLVATGDTANSSVEAGGREGGGAEEEE